MGVLVSSAVPRHRCPEEANIRAPESVVSVHASFIRAGAGLIETNTFGANRHKLRSQYLEDDVARINEAGVKLAREARDVAGRDVYIGGSIGPLGELDGLPPDERGAIFAEQAQLLEGRGVDLFMVETFFDLDELATAIEAVQSVSRLPIVAMLTFDEDAETFGGVSARDAVERLARYDLAAVGANHGAGLHAALAALEAMGDGRPLAALPNVGLASLSGGRVIYPHATPEYFAEFAAQARALGARVIGGCCGTTPIEIAAIAHAVEEDRRPAARRRLPRLARRLRGGLDRPGPGRLPPERGRGLQRQGDRRADVVLPRRCRQPVGRRPRDGARALPREDRGRRRLRDDAGALRPRLPRPLRGAARRLADPDPGRDLHRPLLRARRPAAQRGARDRRSRRRAGAPARRG